MLNLSENERMFEPLLIALAKQRFTDSERDRALENYMFMYEGEGIAAYKHFWTREYVYIDGMGYVIDGNINTDAYPEQSLPYQEVD